MTDREIRQPSHRPTTFGREEATTTIIPRARTLGDPAHREKPRNTSTRRHRRRRERRRRRHAGEAEHRATSDVHHHLPPVGRRKVGAAMGAPSTGPPFASSHAGEEDQRRIAAAWAGHAFLHRSRREDEDLAAATPCHRSGEVRRRRHASGLCR